MAWKVHKFGGTSVASAERYRNVAKVVRGEHEERSAVVVSAMAGVTNALIELVELATARDIRYRSALRDLHVKILETVGELVKSESNAELLVERFEANFNDTEDVLRALWLLQSTPENALSLVSGFGEVWSAQLLAAHLIDEGLNATWIDAREVLVVDPGVPSPYVRWEDSQANIDHWLGTRDEDFVVITGFVASDVDGIPTTLGRNGSDYSASIFGSLLDATVINIWTDVDGVMSANPREVPDAVVLDAMSYHEAMELAYFGAKVIHPSTMAPAVAKNIPIFIKNTFNAGAPGTRIHNVDASGFGPKGIATVDGMAMINVEGTSMIGVPGIASRLFGSLRESGVSVVMISQGSSEHSICFVVPESQAEASVDAVKTAFYAELHRGQIQTVEVIKGCSILALVGDNMAGIPGIAAKFFGALGQARVNVRAIAQGSSERNISIVIDTKESARALKAVHSGFYLGALGLSVGVIGTGVVGSTLLEQLATKAPELVDEIGVELRVRGLATSSKMVLSESAMSLTNWEDHFDDAQPSDLSAFADFIKTDSVPHAVIIDCSASDAVAKNYADWLERGIHIITPNKKANSNDYDYYRHVKDVAAQVHGHYLYETTVGAGLPIIQTLQDLVHTGDDVHRVEGIFSGTLSYLFNSFDGSKPFSEIVLEAKKLGFTEPDPRDDLSGMDVARKLVILAREMGQELQLDDVKVTGLVPDELSGLSVPEFLEALPKLDQTMADKLKAAQAAGTVLRFVGAVDAEGNATVGLEEYPEAHPFGRIRLTDNIVQFTTERYLENPLVVQGPGAGPAVTAGGVFADLIKLAMYLGA